MAARQERRYAGEAASDTSRSRVAVVALVVALATVAGGCKPVDFVNELDDPGLDIARMETDLRSQLQRDLESRSRSTSSSVASVGRVRCRERSDVEATCFARLSRSTGRRLRKLTVSIDPESGLYRWEYAR
jgi:hypothetical protein